MADNRSRMEQERLRRLSDDDLIAEAIAIGRARNRSAFDVNQAIWFTAGALFMVLLRRLKGHANANS